MRGQPLTLYEREKIELHLRAQDSLRGIAKMLHRDHSVLVREVERNTCRDGTYRAEKAHEHAEKRKGKKRKRKLEADEEPRRYVVKQMIDEQWSPAQISAEIKKRHEPWMNGKGISHETIYQFIYAGQGRFLGLYQYLRRGRKKRQRRYGRKQRRNQPISFITPLRYRPREVNEKMEFGHWETDTTVCENNGEAISVQYERSTQLCRLTKVVDRGADLSKYTSYDIHLIQEKLNDRPRKTLGYQSPNSLLQELRASGVVHC